MINQRTFVDYGLFGGAGSDNIEKISELIKKVYQFDVIVDFNHTLSTTTEGD